jgi:hypothetical protein
MGPSLRIWLGYFSMVIQWSIHLDTSMAIPNFPHLAIHGRWITPRNPSWLVPPPSPRLLRLVVPSRRPRHHPPCQRPTLTPRRFTTASIAEGSSTAIVALVTAETWTWASRHTIVSANAGSLAGKRARGYNQSSSVKGSLLLSPVSYGSEALLLEHTKPRAVKCPSW